MDDLEAFGHLLRRLRKAQDLTQAALAEQAACATDTIKRIEAGVRRPSRHLAVQLADALGLAGAEQAAFLAAARAVGVGAGETAGTAMAIKESGARPPRLVRRPSLPAQMTSFIGRGPEIARVTRLLSSGSSRLVTLTGAGGCGKTRLAHRVASELQDAYPDGVYWVEFATLFDPLLVPQRIAAALEIQTPAGHSPIEQLVDFLRTKTLLLVLDNCEHLLSACAALAEDLLRACPAIGILATSREALGVAGETAYVVPSLNLPGEPVGRTLAPADLRRLEEAEAVCLFVERARAVQPGFALTVHNAAALVQICRYLDGIPLALELAAARVKLMQVDEIAGYLDNCFALLSGSIRSAPTRHQTLRAAIDWSYALLSDAERVLLRRLAVFAGGFTLEAAQAVCAGPALAAEQVFDQLARLVDKSLVIVGQDYQPTRYRLLEPIRQYARERLLEVGESGTVGSAHAAFFCALAEQAAPRLSGAEHTTWLKRLQDEQDNLRTAVQWAVQRNDAALGVRLAQALYWFWFLTGVVSEGRRSVSGILAVAARAGRAEERASALGVAGYLAFLAGDNPATAHAQLEESVQLYRGLGDKGGLAHSLNALAYMLVFEGDADTARRLSEESVRLFREVGDVGSVTFPLVALTVVATEQADYAAARTFAEETLALYQAIGNPWGVAIALNRLGDLARCEADYWRAEDFYTRARQLFEEVGVQAETASILHNLGYIAVQRGDLARAHVLFAESLALQREHGNRAGILEALAGFGALLAAQGQPRRGAVLMGAVATLRSAFSAPLWPAERIENERHLAKVRNALGSATLNVALAEGAKLTLEQAIAYALERADTRPVAHSQAERPAWGGLTDREREVVALIAQGQSNREIAAALTVTERTVEAHIRNIRGKLDVTSRAQLAVWAVERGLVAGRS